MGHGKLRIPAGVVLVSALWFSAAFTHAPGSAAQSEPASTSAASWMQSATAARRVSLKPNSEYHHYETLSLDPVKSRVQLQTWKDQGFSVIEIFAPADGGNSYNGLDVVNHDRVEPSVGTLNDVSNVIRIAHSLGLRVIFFDNLGYSSTDAPEFLKASDDVREGKDTREARLYLWSDREDAPPPSHGNSYFLSRPSMPNYQPEKSEYWQWSERARHFYWTKWHGHDAQGNAVRLPQYSWLSDDWPAEAERTVNLWMSLGADGMIIDAVNWYVGCDWTKLNQRITLPVHKFGDVFLQPEGGGAFFTDDPVGWVTEGHWTNLQDYGLDTYWQPDRRFLMKSINEGDPGILESALQNYHDRVIATGATLYACVADMKDPAKQKFAEALLATLGDILCYSNWQGHPLSPDSGAVELLKLKAANPALWNLSSRRRIPTNDDAHLYAFLRTSADDKQRILALFNFGGEAADASIDLNAIDYKQLRPLAPSSPESQETKIEQGRLHTAIGKYGWRLFLVAVE